MSSTSRQVRPGILCIVLLSGLCSCLRQYIFINEPKPWNAAQSYCRDEYTDLATVDTMNDLEQLIAAVDSSFSGKVWIGLYDIWWSWRYLPDDKKFRPEDYRNWARIPNNYRRAWELCGALRNGKWEDNYCTANNPFVCYNNTNTDLPNDSTERYIFINEEKTWHRARDYCAQHHTHLATVRSETESNVIRQVVPQDTMTFIGMYRFTWKWWSDGTEHIFNHWKPNHPLAATGDCGVTMIDASRSGQLVEDHCVATNPFMCYLNITKVYRVKLTVRQSTIDLNDPAVTEAIQSLLTQKLNENGVATGLRFTWMQQPDHNIFYNDANKHV
ncbi:macrophage mannose receptor 1-like [Cololabis saira]|uniref:macrophage mannose receptor 1-like n=1 Tax=Cololabis saira TaxID=129043 RepID=UPI002AD2A73D|nr:macrophage mannose receptor 1-like [Cololabis saira]